MSTALMTAMRAVADARAEHFTASEQLYALQVAFAETNKQLIADVAAKKAAVFQAEANAKALIALQFQQTKDRAPIAGAEVKLFKTLRYDVARAFTWAKEKGLALIPEQLDVKAFEKIAAVTELEFVTRDVDPRVQLAGSLNAADYVETAEGPHA